MKKTLCKVIGTFPMVLVIAIMGCASVKSDAGKTPVQDTPAGGLQRFDISKIPRRNYVDVLNNGAIHLLF